MKSYFQRMGRSLMLPVAVLPAAAVLMGISNWVSDGGKNVSFASQFLSAAGGSILNHLALLFAVGLALGMASDKDGSAALAGLVAYLVPSTILSQDSVALLQGLKNASEADPSFASMGNNVLIGIIAGLVAAAMYNRFHNTKLPMALSFFSGKRLVPIMSALVMLAISLVLYFVWPVIFAGLVAFAKAISSLGFVGAGLYGFFNRLLIPTGMHHALNSVFWFDVANINDIGNFWASKGVKGVTGMYQAGFFPVMMFGLPAGALAIYQCAKPENKKVTASLMMAAAFASFFTGVTEPLEFSFMFVAWPLYVLHAIFTGLSLAFAAFMHWTAGFAFSAGLVDYVMSLKIPIANQPLMLLVQGVGMAAIYYFGFRFAITKFNLMTPGREEAQESNEELASATGNDKFAIQAKIIYVALGGDENVTAIDNCTTRLRLQVKDTDLVNQAQIKTTGVPGINVLDKTNIQVIVGTEVQFVADEMKKLVGKGLTEADIASAKVVTAASDVASTTAPNKSTATLDKMFSVANGEVMSIEEVNDQVFSTKMMGDGYAVKPSNGQIYTPVAGKITSVFPTMHAMGIQTKDGLEVLLHMGLDTVELNGAPFEVHVKDGQEVQAGELVATVDLAALESADKDNIMIVVVTNMDAVEKFELVKTGQVSHSEEVADVLAK